MPGSGFDNVLDGRGADVVFAGPGPDQIFTGPGPNVIYMGPGHDYADDGNGNDVFWGQDGFDVVLLFRGWNDVFVGGADRDSVGVFHETLGPVTIDLTAGSGGGPGDALVRA